MNESTVERSSTTTRLKTRWLGGLRCRSRIDRPKTSNKHSSVILESDACHIADVRGTDTSASAAEHLLHALASSMTATMAVQAERVGIDVQRIVSHSTGERPLDQGPAADALPLEAIDITFSVSSNSRATDLEPLCANDPVYQTLRRALPINIKVESDHP